MSSNLANLVYWLKQAHLSTRNAFDNAFAGYGVTGAQSEILYHLARQDGLAQYELQERLGVTPATLTGIVNGLVKRDLVERRVDAADARVKQLWLTPAGKDLLQELEARAEEVYKMLGQGFTASEVNLLSDWLQRLVENNT